MDHFEPILAYFSPEEMLPMTSILATIAGFAMLLGREVVWIMIRLCRPFFRRHERLAAGVSRPHFRIRKHFRSTKNGR